MKQLRFIGGLIFTFLLQVTILSSCTSSEKKLTAPNVLIFLADDLGYSDISVYRNDIPRLADHHSTAQTPHIDRLAENGIRFTDYYCGAAVCSPSRAALLTGRNATRCGIYNYVSSNAPMHLRNNELTLGELLRHAGYNTAHFGKWHLTAQPDRDPLPMDQGFDYAFYTLNNAKPSHHNPVNFYRNGRAVDTLQGYACHLVADEAIQWLENNRSNPAPLYLNVWFNEPHEKVAAPDSLKNKHPRHGAYYGAIENLDLAVGRIVDYLNTHDLLDNTILVFASDNGSQVVGSNEPWRGEKCFNLEGGVRSPFIVHWHARIKQNQISNSIGSFTDLLPTLATIIGLELPSDRSLDGVDQSRNWLENAQDKRKEPVFFFRYFHDPVCMLREGKWVLLGYYNEILPIKENYNEWEQANLKPDPGKPRWSKWGYDPEHEAFMKDAVPMHFQLFDIENDRNQRNDLSDTYPDLTNKMKHKMLELRKEMIAEGGQWYATAP